MDIYKWTAIWENRT